MTRKMDIEIEPDILESIVKPAVEIAKDGLTNFHWKETELQIDTVDPANAIVVKQRVPSSAFEKYEVESDSGGFVIGTKCKTISNLLKAASTNDVISLHLKNERGWISIQFSDINYRLSGVNPETVDQPSLPEFEYDIKALIHSNAFKRAHQIIGMISETVEFDITQDTFRIVGRGDTDSAEINVNIGDNEEAILEHEHMCAATIEDFSNPAESRYKSQFIKYISEFTPNDCLEMYIREDYPLRVTTKRANGRIPSEIIVAPRMDDR